MANAAARSAGDPEVHERRASVARARAAFAACFVTAGLCACRPHEPNATPAAADVGSAWPAGTVVVVDEAPITAQEIDIATPWIALIDPASSPGHLRRVALCQIALPRTVARLEHPAARERALSDARAQQAALRAGQVAGPVGEFGQLGERVEGGWGDLGFLVWGELLEAPVGVWTDVIEEPGRFVIARKLGRKDGPRPSATRLEIDAFVFSFLPEGMGQGSMEQLYERHRLTIVDAAWRDVVPDRLLYIMKGMESAP